VQEDKDEKVKETEALKGISHMQGGWKRRREGLMINFMG
jgi:hypothetical protein